MDPQLIRSIAAEFRQAGTSSLDVLVLVELDGAPESVQAEAAIVEPLLRAHGARSVTVAITEADRALLPDLLDR